MNTVFSVRRVLARGAPVLGGVQLILHATNFRLSVIHVGLHYTERGTDGTRRDCPVGQIGICLLHPVLHALLCEPAVELHESEHECDDNA